MTFVKSSTSFSDVSCSCNGDLCVGLNPSVLQLEAVLSVAHVHSKTSFSHASYAAFRPSYPPSLYNHVLSYHHGPKKLALDLGCGTGIVTRALSPHFDKVIGTDPSAGMVRQAREKAPPNVEFREASAESSADALPDESVDCAVAGQAAHWFDFSQVWPGLRRVVRKGGSVAFWGYKDHVFVDFPKATAILQSYTYDPHPDKLGSYWPQPGRGYVQDKLRIIQPPESDWEDVQRTEYEPGTDGPHTGQGTLFMEKELTVGECKYYMRTWSSYHGWSEAHQGQVARSKGGEGDIMDEIFDHIAEGDSYFSDQHHKIRIEWGSGVVMARRK